MQSNIVQYLPAKRDNLRKKTEPEHDKTYEKIIDFLRCAHDERSRTW